MAGLGETAAVLARLRREARASVTNPPSGRLEKVVDFGANPGALAMYLYAPAGLARHRPLVVVLHGCTQTAEHYAVGAGWTALADRFGFALVCPQQTASNNSNACFNWFEPDDIRRGHGEAASIRSMIEAGAVRLGSDPGRIFVTGLSAGGAMAAVMLSTYPELFAGGGVIAGLPYGVAKGASQAFSAMFQDTSALGPQLGGLVRGASPHRGPWPRISVWHGSADVVVKPSNADALVRQWLDVHGVQDGASSTADDEGHEVWTRNGVAVVERRLIAGLGHGTPLSTGGPEGAGQAGSFLLEAGISSSLELLRFWGVAPRESRVSGAKTTAAPTGAEWAVQSVAKLEQGAAAVINKALKAAGLLK